MPQKNSGEIPALMSKIESLYTCISAQMLLNIINCEVASMTYSQLRNRADLLEVVLEEISNPDVVGSNGGVSASQADSKSLFESIILNEVKVDGFRDGS